MEYSGHSTCKILGGQPKNHRCHCLWVDCWPGSQLWNVFHRLGEPPHPRLQMRMNQLRIHERMCTTCSRCQWLCHKYVRWCQKHLWNVHTCMHWCPGHLFTTTVHTTLTAKMHTHLCKHVCVMVQQLCHHGNHCDPSCNLSAAWDTVRIHASPWHSRVVTPVAGTNLLGK